MAGCTIMIQTNKNVEAVVLDASVAVAVSAQESDKERAARDTMKYYSDRQCLFFAPGVIVSESLYVLCKQVDNGKITEQIHALAITKLEAFLAPVLPSTRGDKSLIKRATEIRGTYSCRRSADGLYIALAEQLSAIYETVILTFDEDMPKQAARNAPTVTVQLLPVS